MNWTGLFGQLPGHQPQNAKALGISVSPSMQARADEVIE